MKRFCLFLSLPSLCDKRLFSCGDCEARRRVNMSKGERTWSAKGMEEESLKRTIECLRGRLVAERQYSRAAKENADQLDSKLKELESKLKEETKMRDRAEKKLRLLERKMESLKVSVLSEDSGQQLSSSVSENSLGSCESSITTTVTSGATKHPRAEESDCRVRNRVVLVNLDRNDPETAETKPRDGSYCTADDRNSGVTKISSESCHEKVGPYLEASRPIDRRKVSEEEGNDVVDNTLALVAVNNVEVEECREKDPKVISRSVGEVLEALRLAREGIQRSMRQKQKHMIRLGPTQAQPC